MTLYKYVKPDRIDVFTRGFIRFTQAAATNDLFELRPVFTSIVTEDFARTYLSDHPIDVTPHCIEVYEKLPQDMKDKVTLEQVVAFATSRLATPEGLGAFWESFRLLLNHLNAVAPTLRDQMTQQLGARVGILSLSEVPDNPVMWAHYAANHTGFVICFNDKDGYFDRRRSENDEFLHLRPVRYLKETQDKTLADLTGEHLLAAKMSDWSYEKEWRMLVPLDMADRVISETAEHVHLFAIPSSCIEGVIIGAKASDALAGDFKKLRAKDPRFHHLTLAQARVAANRTAVEIHSLEGVD